MALGSNYGDICLGVDGAHSLQLGVLLLRIILYDAKSIDPNVGDAEVNGKSQHVVYSPWQGIRMGQCTL